MMPVTTAIGVRAASAMPLTTPTTTSPSTMMVNRSNRSIIDSLALVLVSRVTPLRQSRIVMPASQPTTTSAQATRRAPSGSSALAPTTAAETRTPAMYGEVAGRNEGSSWRRTEYQSQPSRKRYPP